MNNEPESQQDPAPTPIPAKSILPTPTLSARDIDFGTTPPTTPYQSLPTDNLPSTTPPKKSQKKAILIILSLIVLILIGAVVVANLLFFQPKQTQTATVAATNSVQSTENAKALIEEVRTAQEKLTTTYPKSTVKNVGKNYSPAFKYADANYYVSGPFGENIDVTDTSTDETMGSLSTEPITKDAQKTATDVLDTHTSLKKTSSEYMATYQNADVICTVSLGAYPISTNCTDAKDYKTLSEELKPFAESYIEVADKDYSKDAVFTKPVITTKTDGYSNASISISSVGSITGGFSGLFYAENGVWTYFLGAQDIVDCAKFNTYALQKSFEGDDCWDSSATPEKASTVVVKLSK
ncbi:MAG: hypothetical protein ACOH18_04490 [Candidatus Saccharimonadaceae bacterium]